MVLEGGDWQKDKRATLERFSQLPGTELDGR